MHLSQDELILWQLGWLKVNGTLVATWVVMLVLTLGAHLVTRRLTTRPDRTRWQTALEVVVTTLEGQIAAVGLRTPRRYLPFIGALFLFIAMSTLLSVVPGFEPPTGSLSTTAALALCVFVAVPIYGIAAIGVRGYLRTWLEPSPLLLPINIVSEVSRTLALAVRLFGNMMSGAMILAILLSLTPLFFPIVMSALGLVTGLVQAYIFAILATVYIAAATEVHPHGARPNGAHSNSPRRS